MATLSRYVPWMVAPAIAGFLAATAPSARAEIFLQPASTTQNDGREATTNQESSSPTVSSTISSSPTTIGEADSGPPIEGGPPPIEGGPPPSSVVPAPPSVVMGLLGFGMTGWYAWRQRRRTSSAQALKANPPRSVLSRSAAGVMEGPRVILGSGIPRWLPMFSPFSRRDRQPSLFARPRQTLRSWRPILEVLEERDVPSTIYTVTNTGDASESPTGQMSLRQAINAANDTEGPAIIDFNIRGEGTNPVFTISPRSPLPSLENTIEIDGTSQTAFNGGTIVLNGRFLTDGGIGLEIDASNCTVQGLAINGFADDPAIEITGETSMCLIQNNSIGGPSASNYYGVEVLGDHNTISGNVISDNTGAGILLLGSASFDNVITGNFIGTDASGLIALPNGTGIQISGGSSQNTIGGATTAVGLLSGPGNLISGNDGAGIEIDGPAPDSEDSGFSTQNLILGNFIGTDVTGDVPLGNGGDGVFLNNSTNNTVGAGNVIAGNGGDGVLIRAPYGYAIITGDYQPPSSDYSGPVYVPSDGVVIPSLGDNIIEYNFIGTDQSATLALGNGGDGVGVDGSYGNQVLGNAVFDNGGLGISLLDNGNDNQVPPQITAATYDGSTLTITWALPSPVTTLAPFRIEFFDSTLPGSDTSGEGQQFLGFASAVTDDNGQASGTVTFTNVTLVGRYLTATATDNTPLDTSEFSLPFLVTPIAPPDSSPPIVPFVRPPSTSQPRPVGPSESSPPVTIILLPVLPELAPPPLAGPDFDPSDIGEFFAAEAVAGHHDVKEIILLPQGLAETVVVESFLPAKAHTAETLTFELTSRANTTCTITGVVFQDSNGDGLREGNEPPLEGMCVYLERIDGGDTGPVPVAYTDSNGQYKFEGLAPGSYVVRPLKHRLYRVSAPETGFERVNLHPEGSASVPFGCKPQKTQTDGDPDSDARPLRQHDRLMEARDTVFVRDEAPWWGGVALAGMFVGGSLRRAKREED